MTSNRPAAVDNAAAIPPAATTLLANAAPTPNEALPVAGAETSPYSALARLAQDHYARALDAQRDGNWAQYGEEIERLGAVLGELENSGGNQN